MSLAPMQLRGFAAWASGAPDWATLRAIARGEATAAADAPKKPAPAMLPPNERRRAPDSVLLALQVAQAACEAAQADPASTPSIFASTHGDLAITDAICSTLATNPAEMSPTRFHNSVHNAASGYWTIGVGSHAPSTAISAFRATLAQGLIEAAMQLDAGAPRVLLVAYDSAAGGPLSAVSTSEGLLGLAMVFDREPSPATRFTLSLDAAPADHASQAVESRHPVSVDPASTNAALDALVGRNAMAPALALLDALAHERARCVLPAGLESTLAIEISHG